MPLCKKMMFLCLDILINCLLADCEAVLTLLCSEVLQTEIRVLYELLYVLNNGFRQHKPFRALKQVGTPPSASMYYISYYIIIPGP